MNPVIKPISLESMLLSLKKDNAPVVDRNQALALLSLKFSNDEPILTLEDRNFVYEIVNLLMKKGFDVTYNFLNQDWEKEVGLSYDTRKRILFRNPLYEEMELKFINDTNFYKNRIEVSAGEKCKKCGSIETISVEKQLKAQDEQASIRVTCLQCKNHWMAQ